MTMKDMPPNKVTPGNPAGAPHSQLMSSVGRVTEFRR